MPLSAHGPSAREERRLVSVIFVDLVGFTSSAENLDPEDVRAVLRPYHESVRSEIESFGGVVEKFIGDAVVGVFGAPQAYGDDAERAVRAALTVRDLNAGDLRLRIAVNTGEAIVTLAARPELGESMIAGDVVNTAARLQVAAPEGGVLVGEETYRATREAVEYAPTAPVVAKGKASPLQAWIAVRARLAAGERRLTSDLVGRKRELALLRGIWDRVAATRDPHLVTVIGATGIGKTRLAAEFGQLIESTGGRSVRGRSLPYRDSSAYGAFAAQVKQLCRIFESDSVELANDKLRATVRPIVDANADAVIEHLGILIGARPGAVSDRETLFFSIRVFIEAVARDQPTLLVFEDVHWADSSLLDLIELLAARLRELPVLLLALARPELLDLRPGWGGGLPGYTALPLGPLGVDDAALLATQRLAGMVGGSAAQLADTAGGNPLFIEQLAATISESGEGADRHRLPTTMRGILGARLDALPTDERALLVEAAVAGKVFWRGALERMTPGRDRLSDLLGALERRDLIRRETVSSIEGDQQFTFTHVLIRDAAYDLLPRARRQELHAAVAAFLESATAEVGEAGAAIARNWRDAGDKVRALQHFVTAAEHASNGWAKDRAATFYREALSLVDPDNPEQRTMLRRRLALAMQAAYHVPDARSLIGDDTGSG